MNKKTLVLVALSLSVCAFYGRQPPAVSWIPVNPMHPGSAFFCGSHAPRRQFISGWRLRRDRVAAQLRRQL